MNSKNDIITIERAAPHRAIRNFVRTAAIAAAALALLGFAGPSDSSAQRRLDNRGTPEEQEACRPDVFRLCFSAIPDEPRIVACLHHRKEALSPACRMVIDPPPPRPRRKAKPRPPKPRARQ